MPTNDVKQSGDLRQDTCFMGRTEELYQLVRNLQQGRHTLLVGEKGIGKSRLMREARLVLSGTVNRIEFAAGALARLRGRLAPRVDADQYRILFIERSTPMGDCLKEIAEKLYSMNDLPVAGTDAREDWPTAKKRLAGSGSVKMQESILEGIARSAKPYLIFFDNLDRVTPGQQAFIESLLNSAVLCAAVVQMKEHFAFKRIWASFVKIQLGPLPQPVCEQLIRYFFENYPLHSIDPELHRMEVLKASNGNPFHIKNMLWHGSRERHVEAEGIRSLRRVQEGRYFNMGPVYIFGASAFTIFKIFSLGTDNQEFYIYFSALGVFVYLTFRVFRAFFLFRPQRYDQ